MLTSQTAPCPHIPHIVSATTYCVTAAPTRLHLCLEQENLVRLRPLGEEKRHTIANLRGKTRFFENGATRQSPGDCIIHESTRSDATQKKDSVLMRLTHGVGDTEHSCNVRGKP